PFALERRRRDGAMGLGPPEAGGYPPLQQRQILRERGGQGDRLRRREERRRGPKPVKRLRALDGVAIFPGRRLSMHVMIQPDAAAAFLGNETLRDQGLLSRLLIAAPPSTAGTRLYKETSPSDTAAIHAYGARLLGILEAEPALHGKRNELSPPALP